MAALHGRITGSCWCVGPPRSARASSLPRARARASAESASKPARRDRIGMRHGGDDSGASGRERGTSPLAKGWRTLLAGIQYPNSVRYEPSGAIHNDLVRPPAPCNRPCCLISPPILMGSSRRFAPNKARARSFAHAAALRVQAAGRGRPAGLCVARKWSGTHSQGD